MNAIIYAAGRSTRMGPAYRTTPKILLEIGGASILEWHLRHLELLGIESVTFITGHLREKIAEQLDVLSVRYKLEIREILNPNFSEGSVLSMQVSLPVIQQQKGPVLLMDGDVFYDPDILRRLILSPHPTALLVDLQYNDQDDDPVLVPIRNGRPVDFIKKWTGQADAIGESVGFFKISEEEFPLLEMEIAKRITGVCRTDSYDDVIRALVQMNRFGYEEITGMAWTEIDFPYDLTYARDQVFPAFQISRQAL